LVVVVVVVAAVFIEVVAIVLLEVSPAVHVKAEGVRRRKGVGHTLGRPEGREEVEEVR
jgi:hypothetical protein